MTPRLVLIVREDGTLQATCDCGDMDEIVPTDRVPSFMAYRVAGHVIDHSIAEKRAKAAR